VRDHDVSDMFTTYILKKEEDEEIKEDLYEILDILYWFRGTWALSRYPVIKRGKVVSPAEQYDKENAETALEKAKFVFESATSLLKERYKVKVTENNDQEK